MISKAAHTIVDAMERRKINMYITLAKLGLWLTSAVLLLVITGCSILVVFTGDVEQISNVVGATQALVVVALSVLGFHNYQGSQMFHVLRHWNDVAPPSKGHDNDGI